MSSRPPTNPASNTSGFPAHTAKSKFDHDLSVAKLPAAKFSALIQSLGAPTVSATPGSSSNPATATPPQTTVTSQETPGTSPTSAYTFQPSSTQIASSLSGTASVITGVTTLPKPTHSLSSLPSNSTAAVVSTGVTILPSLTVKSTTAATIATPILSTSKVTETETFPFDPPIPTTSFTVSRIPDSPWTQTIPFIKSSSVVSVPTIARSSSVRPSPVRPSPVRPTPPRGRPPPGRGPPWRQHPP